MVVAPADVARQDLEPEIGALEVAPRERPEPGRERDGAELQEMFRFALKLGTPAAIRYPKSQTAAPALVGGPSASPVALVMPLIAWMVTSMAARSR